MRFFQSKDKSTVRVVYDLSPSTFLSIKVWPDNINLCTIEFFNHPYGDDFNTELGLDEETIFNLKYVGGICSVALFHVKDYMRRLHSRPDWLRCFEKEVKKIVYLVS